MSVAAAIAGLLGTMVSVGAQASAQQSQERMNNKTLAFQRDQAERQEDLMTADRTDPQGNRLQYSDETGFEVILAPLMQAIVDAQSEEQYKNVTQDAKRNRAARERQDERSQDASAAFEKAFKEVMAAPDVDVEGRGAEKAVETAQLYGSESNPAMDAAVMQAVRSGNPSVVNKLVDQGDGPNNAFRMAAAIREGRRRGEAEGMAEQAAQDELGQQELAYLQAFADAAPQAGISFSNINDSQQSRASNAINALLNVMQRNATAQTGTMNKATELAGQVPDYGRIFQSLGKVLGQVDFDKLKPNVGMGGGPAGGMMPMA